jgi:hypothetical protein
MKSRIPAMAFLLMGTAGSFAAMPAQAERTVVVNGQQLSPAQIARLDALACISVQDGKYWLRNDGSWGYAQDPTRRGRLGDYCWTQSPSENRLLSRRGEMLSK